MNCLFKGVPPRQNLNYLEYYNHNRIKEKLNGLSPVQYRRRIYENDINGSISHKRFMKLSAEHEAKQKELTEIV